MTYASADDLITAAVPEADLELSDGQTIRLRGLTRYQLFKNGEGTESSLIIETRNLVSCLVEPTLTREQAEAFMQTSGAGVLGEISQKIRELSGLATGADKSGVAEVRD